MKKKKKRTRPIRIRQSEAAGMIPGSIVHIGQKKVDQATMELFDYSAEDVKWYQTLDLEECVSKLNDKQTVTWLNVNGIHDISLLQGIGNQFNLHSLTLEDIANTSQRPKIEMHDNYMFFTLKMLEFDREQKEVVSEQVSFVLSDSVLISFQEKEGDVFTSVRERIMEAKGRVRTKNSDYLLYALVDVIIDHYFFIIEAIGDQLEYLEEGVLDDPSPETLEEIQRLKKELRDIRKAVFPLREGINSILRGESRYINQNIFKYYRDLYDHTISVIETVETHKEQLSSVKDLYLSSLSNKMNNIMKVLTIMASIFIPLTFVSGIYGMNFANIPELNWEHGYLYFWGLIITLTILMILLFKKQKWL